MEACEDIRYTTGMKDLYKHRKETIERLFGTAKENHGFRYTQMYGKARMEMKVGLTYACLNLKKLAKMLYRMGIIDPYPNSLFRVIYECISIKRKNGCGTKDPQPALSTV
ncbi:Transposase DDE domain-containing protein [Lachnospiraceae bacterium NE2001]|nr:Transposase DDE domain-containing protein [Lachnospiraceae bacterium NE2001]